MRLLVRRKSKGVGRNDLASSQSSITFVTVLNRIEKEKGCRDRVIVHVVEEMLCVQ